MVNFSPVCWPRVACLPASKPHDTAMKKHDSTIGVMLWRGCRLRCPVCGAGRLFRGWFRMHSHCDRCGLKFERAPGYFLGSIYFNYGVTTLLLVVAYAGLYVSSRLAPEKLPQFLLPTSKYLIWLFVAGAVCFPLWFFRYARSLWLGFDMYFDPPRVHNDQQAHSAGSNEPDTSGRHATEDERR